jgi:hypothetical protein
MYEEIPELQDLSYDDLIELSEELLIPIEELIRGLI